MSKTQHYHSFELPDVVTSGLETNSTTAITTTEQTTNTADCQNGLISSLLHEQCADAFYCGTVTDSDGQQINPPQNQQKSKVSLEAVAFRALNKILPHDSRCFRKASKCNTKTMILRKCTRYIEYLLVVAWKLAEDYQVPQAEFLQTLASDGCSLTEDVLLLLDSFRPLTSSLKPETQWLKSREHGTTLGRNVPRLRSLARKSDWRSCSIISLAPSEKHRKRQATIISRRTSAFTQTEEDIKEFIEETEKRKRGKRLKRKLCSSEEISAMRKLSARENACNTSNNQRQMQLHSHPSYGVGVNLFPDFGSLSAWDTPSQQVPSSSNKDESSDLVPTQSPRPQDGTDFDWLYELLDDSCEAAKQAKNKDDELVDLFDLETPDLPDKSSYHPSNDHCYGKDQSAAVEIQQESSIEPSLPLFDLNELLNSTDILTNPTCEITESALDSSFMYNQSFPSNTRSGSMLGEGTSGSAIQQSRVDALSPPFIRHSSSRSYKVPEPYPGTLGPVRPLDFSPRLFLNLSTLAEETCV